MSPSRKAAGTGISRSHATLVVVDVHLLHHPGHLSEMSLALAARVTCSVKDSGQNPPTLSPNIPTGAFSPPASIPSKDEQRSRPQKRNQCSSVGVNLCAVQCVYDATG